MTRDDWFRGVEWSKEYQEKFFERLNRSRSNFHKAQYARIKAGYLLGSGKKKLVEESIVLTHRILDEWVVDTELASCLLQLAQGYSFLGEQENAVSYFEKCLKQEGMYPGVTTMCDIEYAEYIVKNEITNLYKRCIEVLTKSKRINDGLNFPSDLFLFHGLQAVIQDAEGLKESEEHAQKAMKYASRVDSGLTYHKKIGLVSKKHWLITELESILND